MLLAFKIALAIILLPFIVAAFYGLIFTVFLGLYLFIAIVSIISYPVCYPFIYLYNKGLEMIYSKPSSVDRRN